MTMRPISRKPMSRASGVLVRSTTQATKAPMHEGDEGRRQRESDSVLPLVRQNEALPKARA